MIRALKRDQFRVVAVDMDEFSSGFYFADAGTSFHLDKPPVLTGWKKYAKSKPWMPLFRWLTKNLHMSLH